MSKHAGGRPPLPPEERKADVPFRLYPRILAAIKAHAPKGMQAWLELAAYEKMERDGISVIPPRKRKRSG